MQSEKCKIKVFASQAAIIFSIAFLLMPSRTALAIVVNSTSAFENLSAKSFVVLNIDSGDILAQKQPDIIWTPASLTKLVTAMVVLDSNPKLTGYVTMSKTDNLEGASFATKTGVKYKVKDIFYASLVASANNAAHALSRTLKISELDFARKMNEKVRQAGAVSTVFIESTGLNPQNQTTARDYAKIAQAAFAYPEIQKASTSQKFTFRSYGGSSKILWHNLATTDKLLYDEAVSIKGGKTGYLEESNYNFVMLSQTTAGQNIVSVLFGSPNRNVQFQEAKKIALWAENNSINLNTAGAVAGTNSSVSLLQMPIN